MPQMRERNWGRAVFIASEPAVNSVLPGQTLEEAGVAFVQHNHPSSTLGRAAQREEVANMVAYVASPLSSAPTGAALRVEAALSTALGRFRPEVDGSFDSYQRLPGKQWQLLLFINPEITPPGADPPFSACAAQSWSGCGVCP